MKKLFLYLFSVLFGVISMQAQSVTFTATSPDGVLFCYRITDAVNKKVDMIYNPAYLVSPPTTVPHHAKVTIPGTVIYGGKTYTVDNVGEHGVSYIDTDILVFDDNIKLGWQSIRQDGGQVIKNLYFPKNQTVIPNNFLWLAQNGVEKVWLSPKIKEVQDFSLWGTKRLMGFTDSNIEIFGNGNPVYGFPTPDLIQDLSVLPKTIRILNNSCFGYSPMPLDKVTIPASMEQIGSNVYNIANDVYIEGTTPFTLGSTAFGNQPTLKIHMPVDRSFAFNTEPGWSSYADKIVETLEIGTTGYTTYYLENENFKVPTGCTAYIITGITPSGSITNPDQAVVKAFVAGKIIPKKTGFILQGPANSKVNYLANVTGTEENVAGNLLIGTATEQQFSATGKRFYVLANGDQGMGFYKQGTRNGMSIKLKAHRAGLRLDESVAPAKSIVFDFDTAREKAETTGIQNMPANGKQRDDVVYDLQGRRVTNPTHGIYIINGKKVIK